MRSSVHLSTLTLLTMLLFLPLSFTPTATAGTRTSPIASALEWLKSHQLTDGSYGPLTELQTAPASNALWIRFGNTAGVVLSYNWLKNRLQNSTTWFWGSFGEADVPGEVLYSFGLSQHLYFLDIPTIAQRLLGFQQPDGGFKGYAPSGQSVTSSVDTGMALLGLLNAKAIPKSNQLSALNYLLSLQNSDGSFNLTSTVKSDSLYSLGPEPISITALATLVLKEASYSAADPHVSAALTFLVQAATRTFDGHVYAAALSALAFTAFHRPSDVSAPVSFILSLQNADGGFRDVIRSSTGSNALDTGWAALALELGGLFGDVSLDGAVNVVDLVAVGSSFGSRAGASNYSPRADVSADGIINIIDLVLVSGNFGKTADSL